eukprot:6040035-Prymnesium_polylepis.1
MLVLRAGDTLSSIRKEPRGRGHLYLCTDRWTHERVAAQRLPLIAAHLNARATDASGRVSVPSLYEHAHGKWRGGVLKHRYRVERLSLDDAASVMQRLSSGQSAVLLGLSLIHISEPTRRS